MDFAVFIDEEMVADAGPSFVEMPLVNVDHGVVRGDFGVMEYDVSYIVLGTCHGESVRP